MPFSRDRKTSLWMAGSVKKHLWRTLVQMFMLFVCIVSSWLSGSGALHKWIKFIPPILLIGYQRGPLCEWFIWIIFFSSSVGMWPFYTLHTHTHTHYTHTHTHTHTHTRGLWVSETLTQFSFYQNNVSWSCCDTAVFSLVFITTVCCCSVYPPPRLRSG